VSDEARTRYAAVAICPLVGTQVIEAWYDDRQQAEAHAARIGGTVVVGSGHRGHCADHAEPIRR